MKINLKSRTLYIGISACMLIFLSLVLYYALAPASDKEETQYLLIDGDDSIDSVYHKLSQIAPKRGVQVFRTMARHMHYDEHVRTGRYAVEKGERAISLLRTMRNGQQTPMKLVVREVRTLEDLAADLGAKIMADSAKIFDTLNKEEIQNKYNLDSANIITIFVPNTYEVYWDTALEKLFDRMNSEKKRFWNEERTVKAQRLNLTPEQVMTLASIVDEETANNAEKPTIARLYYNRLNLHMPLQADPTVKFALQDFALRRIWARGNPNCPRMSIASAILFPARCSVLICNLLCDVIKNILCPFSLHRTKSPPHLIQLFSRRVRQIAKICRVHLGVSTKETEFFIYPCGIKPQEVSFYISTWMPTLSTTDFSLFTFTSHYS